MIGVLIRVGFNDHIHGLSSIVDYMKIPVESTDTMYDDLVEKTIEVAFVESNQQYACLKVMNSLELSTFPFVGLHHIAS